MLHNRIIVFLFLTVFKPYCKCLSTVPQNQLDPDLQVNIPSGTLQGKKISPLEGNVSYYAYFGIPYAKPPVGNLRFKPPEPASKWPGILDARTERSFCVQDSEGSEDCLFLNVYTPYTEKSQGKNGSLPVMVWIHGGGFLMGSSNYSTYGPDYLLQHDVVVVTFNYRLGVFGFLNTADMNSPGNYGLKDQIEALKWVHRNIRRFGGDPSLVTIFGESAGSVSVHYLLQTPLTKDLFHRAISESGSSLSAGVAVNNTRELVEKLTKLDYEELSLASEQVLLANLVNFYNGLPFSPSVEPKHRGAVVTEGSYSILASNKFHKVPLLTGFNSDEARLGTELSILQTTVRGLLLGKDVAPSRYVHENMNIHNLAVKLKAGLAIKSFYFGRNLATTPTDNDLANFITDDQFIRPIRETVKLHSRSSPVYFYRFSYNSLINFFGQVKTSEGAQHGDEVQYIFAFRWKNKPVDVNDCFVKSQMSKLWTNFAKTGNPTPIFDKLLNNITWPAVSGRRGDDLQLLDINSALSVDANPKNDAMKFWDDFYETYGYPHDTY